MEARAAKPSRHRSKSKPNLPPDAEMVSLPLRAPARAALQKAMEQLSQEVGRRVSPVTLLELLFTDEHLQASLTALRPRLDKLKELEKQRESLGLYFLH